MGDPQLKGLNGNHPVLLYTCCLKFKAHLRFFLSHNRLRINKGHIIAVIGDLNVKVGSDAYWQWACTVNHFETDETNERGLRLLGFAQSHRLTLDNTLHPI